MNALVQTRDTAFDAAAYAIQADLMDQIKFQWYGEMYGEGFGYENHIRWDDPIDLTNSGADPVYYGKGFSQAVPSTNNDLGGTTEPIKDPNYIGYTSERFVEIKDSKKAEYGMAGTGHNTHPYMHYKMKNKEPGTINPDDIILMRSSEMYLIEAEAEAMLGNIGPAQAALQVLGGKRDTAYDATAFATPAALMDQIKFQYYVEHYGEGFGYENHIRWDDPLDLTNSGADPVYYGKGFSQAAPSVNDDWIWKIPQKEIDANPNLTEANQN